MSLKRIKTHPILNTSNRTKVKFYWNKLQLYAFENETISSALLANGIKIFNHHIKDHSPQGMFCANGQCSQCMVLSNDIAVKSCMTKIENNMRIESLKGLPPVNKNKVDLLCRKESIKRYNVPVLIIGGGPAGLSAAIELGKLNIETILVDDKDCLGGKLILQTHKFFGSVEDSHAGVRGFKIGSILEKKLKLFNSVNVWLNSTVVGIFSDGIVGILKDKNYLEIKPDKLLIATGAREKMILFPGNTLPGVFGAGAFQTLVNRDLIKISNKVLIVGGGNVGLIAGYHALQAGIKVVGLIEAMPELGGYKVHSDKLQRMGVPIFKRHTVISANGENNVERAIIAELDDNWKPKPGTYKKFDVDTILVAAGLVEVNEFYIKAKHWDMNVYAAGDCKEIAEASSAMFSGKIEGLKIAQALGYYKKQIPADWISKSMILKSKPGNYIENKTIEKEEGVFPIFHCHQKIPCNPCTSVCPEHSIKTLKDEITGLPYITNPDFCKGCLACIAICPGLAITLVDYRENNKNPTITIAHELDRNSMKVGDPIFATDAAGMLIGKYSIKRIITNKKKYPQTMLIQIDVERDVAKKITGIQVQNKQDPSLSVELIQDTVSLPDEAIVCRCERVSVGQVRDAIRRGITDLNQMKAINRIGMGACGSKTCRPILWQIFREEGIKNVKQITDRVDRPLFIEVSIGALAGIREKYKDA